MTARRIFLPALAALAALTTLALLADPYWLFGTGLTQHKPGFARQAAMAKTYALDRARPRTLLLGGAAVQSGLDPQSPVWPADARPVFNAALDGGDLFLASRLLDEAIASGPVKTVIVALDFRAFLQPSTPLTGTPPMAAAERRLKWDRAGRPNRYRLLQIGFDGFGAILSPAGIYDSVFTLADQGIGILTPLGFNPMRGMTKSELFDQNIAQQRQELSAAPRPDFLALYDNAQFRALKRIIQQTRRHGIRLVLFVPPCHARWLDLVQQIGLWPLFEDWKRALVHALALEKGGGADILLVDFSGYHSYAGERWYWNAIQFKPALGDEILKRLIRRQGRFGEVLGPDTVEMALAREREGRAP